MTQELLRRRAHSLRLVSSVVGTVAILVGVAVLGGWAFDVVALKSVLPRLPTMKPNTAVAFVLLGLSLRRQSGHAGAQRAADVCALVAALVGLLTLVEDLVGLDPGLDRLLFRNALLADPRPYAGRMAPPTAASLLFLGLAIPLGRRVGGGMRIAEAFALTAALMSAMAVTGYVYGVEPLYRVAGRAPVGVHTALTVLLLACGLLAAHPEQGLVASVISDGPGGRAARRLLPPAVLLPFFIGWLGVLGQRANLYEAAFGVSVRALAVIIIFSAVIFWNARSLDQLDRERRTAEEAAREKSRVLQLILDSMTDGVAVADAQGQFLVFNRAAEEILGVDAGNTGPQGWSDRYGLFLTDGTTQYPSTELPLARAIRGEEVTNVEMITRNPRRPEGAWLKVSARPLQDPQGVLQGGIALFSDVTEGRRLDEARRRAQELETASREAQEASRLKSAFLANMSHELRTPLNAVIGFAEILHDAKVGPVTPDQKEFLGDILSSSRHLLQLINDILDLSKVEAGRMEFRPERVDVSHVVAEVRDTLRSIAAGKRIHIDIQIDSGLGKVVIDPGKLKQILYNYLSNALKFTPDEGHVTVRAALDGPDRFRLEVEDTGIGIEPEDLKRLFVEFQQLDATAAKRYAGTGLGLALTRRLVEAQGGRAGARSTPGGGSVFYAILPRIAPSSLALDPGSQAAGTASNGDLRKARQG